MTSEPAPYARIRELEAEIERLKDALITRLRVLLTTKAELRDLRSMNDTQAALVTTWRARAEKAEAERDMACAEVARVTEAATVAYDTAEFERRELEAENCLRAERDDCITLNGQQAAQIVAMAKERDETFAALLETREALGESVDLAEDVWLERVKFDSFSLQAARRVLANPAPGVAWLAEKEGIARGQERALVYQELRAGALDGQLVERDARVAAEARRAALEAASQAIVAIAEKPGRGMSGTNRSYLYEAQRAVLALASPAPAPSAAVAPFGETLSAAKPCAVCGSFDHERHEPGHSTPPAAKPACATPWSCPECGGVDECTAECMTPPAKPVCQHGNERGDCTACAATRDGWTAAKPVCATCGGSGVVSGYPVFNSCPDCTKAVT
jgi:hypothetical protein